MSINIQEIKCKNCGANLVTFPAFGRATCEYCGSNYYFDGSFDSEKTFSLPRNDNPINISRLVLDENSNRVLQVFNDKYDLKANFYPDTRGFNSIARGIIDEIINRTKYVAAVSYALKKSFKINGASFYPIEEGFVIDKKDLRYYSKIIHSMGPKTKGELLADVEDVSSKNQECITKVSDYLTKYGFQINDGIERCTGRIGPECYYEYSYVGFDENKSLVNGTYNSHTLSFKASIITPSYLPKFFQVIANRFESVCNNNAIEEIVTRIKQKIEQLRKHVYQNIIFSFGVEKQKVKWCITYGTIDNDSSYMGALQRSFSVEIDFHQLGMEFITDETTRIAVGMAILQKTLESTRKNGKDIIEFCNIDSSSVYDYNSGSEVFEREYRLRLLETIEKKYNSW